MVQSSPWDVYFRDIWNFIIFYFFKIEDSMRMPMYLIGANLNRGLTIKSSWIIYELFLKIVSVYWFFGVHFLEIRLVCGSLESL